MMQRAMEAESIKPLAWQYSASLEKWPGHRSPQAA
jgi:hypothetical protein